MSSSISSPVPSHRLGQFLASVERMLIPIRLLPVGTSPVSRERFAEISIAATFDVFATRVEITM